MAQPIRKRWPFRAVIIIVALGVVAFVISFNTMRKREIIPVRETPTFQPANASGKTTRSNSHPRVATDFEAAIQRVQGATNITSVRGNLAELRDYLLSLRTDVASRTILHFLDTKADVVTHLPFKIGPDGFLTESPSLRVFLLDLLDRIDPVAAKSYAKIILSSMDSADEWAIALRNFAKGSTDAESRTFLHEKIQDMLNWNPWLRNPSEGFLEAFDVAVHLGGTDLIPALTGLAGNKDNQTVSHAAYLALDRLTIADAAGTLSFLRENPDLMRGREATRANFFARADVRDATQRRLVEDYLLNPALNSSELEKFSSLYPNANYMISHNLLTRVVTPDGAWLKARDAAALQLVQEWLADPRFTSLKPQLEAIQRRLKSFTE